MSKGKERDVSRINILVPTNVKEWYQEEAYQMGMSMSALMMITLKQYMDQQRVLTNMDEVMDRLSDIEKQEIMKALQSTIEK